MEAVTVIKLNPAGEETWRYSGEVLARTDHTVLLQALFNRADTPFHGMVFKNNDRFVEIYYSDRWYNIYEIYDRDSGLVKGWYCNVSLPAEFQDGIIRFVDLALDLLVYPDGSQLVLDEDEFAALELEDGVRGKCKAGVSRPETIGPTRSRFQIRKNLVLWGAFLRRTPQILSYTTNIRMIWLN